MTEKKLLCLKIFVFLIYLGLVIGTEIFYRDSLFQKSLSIIPEWKSGTPQKFKEFCILLKYVGSSRVFFALLAIIHIFFPINKSFTFLNVFLYSYYFNNLMKMIYSNPRPFWVDPNINLSCDGSFGNPSGHSMCSAAVYLAFTHIITDHKYFSDNYLRKLLRFSIFLIFIGLILAIMISRVYIGAHSFNQILFGSLLGIAIYVFFFDIIKMHKLSGKSFFNKLIDKKVIIYSSILYFSLLLTGILTWHFVKDNLNIYKKRLQETCPELKRYKKFYHHGLYSLLPICGIIGSHLGLIILAYLVGKNYFEKYENVNHWNRFNFLHNIYRIIVCAVCCITFVLIFLVPGNSSLEIVFIFKVGVPYFITFFSLYGPGIYSCILLKICNRNIYDTKNFHSEIEIHNNYVDLITKNNTSDRLSKNDPHKLL
jgi:membrane-associated phospholipid phosphatase